MALHAAGLENGRRVSGEGSIASSSTEAMWPGAVLRLREAVPLQTLFCGDKRSKPLRQPVLAEGEQQLLATQTDCFWFLEGHT